jgi:pyruvate carboxylase
VIVSNAQGDIKKESLSSGKFKVHYHLNGGIHRMDAIVRNRAESELLALLKEVTTVLGLPVHVETHAYGEGGLVEYLDLVFQNKEQIATVMAILSPLLGAPLYFNKVKQSRQQTQLNELNIKKIKLEIKEKEDAATDREEKKNQVGKSLELPLEQAPTSDDIAQAVAADRKLTI